MNNVCINLKSQDKNIAMFSMLSAMGLAITSPAFSAQPPEVEQTKALATNNLRETLKVKKKKNADYSVVLQERARAQRAQFTRRYLQARASELRRKDEGEETKHFTETNTLVSTSFNIPPVESIIGKHNQSLIVIDQVEFLGNTVISTEELEKIAKTFIGKPIDPIKDINKLREAITLQYVNSGYINSGAVVDNPEVLRSISQRTMASAEENVSNRPNVLRLGIVEGRITETKIDGLERLRESYVTDRLIPYEDEVLNLAVLQERFQLMLQDPLFKKIQSRILPTTEQGGALLDLQIERNPAWTAYFGVNNNRSPASGEHQYSTGINVHNFTSWGDTFSLSASAPQKSGGDTKAYSLSFAVPLPPFQTKIAVGYDKGQTSITEPPFDRLNFFNDNKNVWVSLTQPLFTNLNQVLSVDVSRYDRESKSFINNQPYSLSFGEVKGVTRNKVNRVGLSYTYRQPELAWANRLSYSKGRHNYYTDPRIRNIITVPQNDYTHLIYQTLINYKITDGGQILGLRANWQKTNDYLIGMERFALTSSNAVRGYIENSNAFDNVKTVSLEWQIPLYRSGDGLVIVATPFYDWGEGENSVKQTDNDKLLQVASNGISLSGQFGGFSMKLDYAKPLKNKNIIKSGYQQSKGITYSLRYDF